MTPELIAQCSNGPSCVVELIKRDDTRRALPIVREFDPRWFGMLVYSDVRRGITFDDVAERLRSVLDRCEVERVDAERDRIRWRLGGERIESEMETVINRERGFSPERLEVFTRRRGTEGTWKTAGRSSVKWAERKGIWIPVSVVVEETYDDRIELSLDWLKLEEPIASDEFDVQNIGAPKGTTIVDSRVSENGIIVGRIGRGSLLDNTTATVTGSWPLRARTLFVLASVLCLGLLLALSALRRRSKRSAR